MVAPVLGGKALKEDDYFLRENKVISDVHVPKCFNPKRNVLGNPSHEGGQSISREVLNRRKGGIAKMRLYLQPDCHVHKQSSKPVDKKCTKRLNELTRYVSHILIVHFTLISLINKQFIHLNANCINSTPCSSKCVANGASIRIISSDIRLTRR